MKINKYTNNFNIIIDYLVKTYYNTDANAF